MIDLPSNFLLRMWSGNLLSEIKLLAFDLLKTLIILFAETPKFSPACKISQLFDIDQERIFISPSAANISKFNDITKNRIKRYLKKIINSNPSNDVFEVISKSVN